MAALARLGARRFLKDFRLRPMKPRISILPRRRCRRASDLLVSAIYWRVRCCRSRRRCRAMIIAIRARFIAVGNFQRRAAPIPDGPTPWLDLSTGINAVPFRIANVLDETWKRLPEASALKRLQEAAAKAYGSRSPRQIVPAAGTQALIQWMPWLFPRARGYFGLRLSGASIRLADRGR